MIRRWKLLTSEVEELNNHIKLLAKNTFNKWRLFCGFDTMKFIVDLFKGEDQRFLYVRCHLLFCKSQKKMVAYILQLNIIFKIFLIVFIIRFLFFANII